MASIGKAGELFTRRGRSQSAAGALHQRPALFFFFSNRLGCFGSILVSALLTLFLLFLFDVL